MMKFLLLIAALFSHSGIGLAQDECDDYLARHHKQDLKPEYLIYKEPIINGQKRTFLFVVVKSVGQEDVNSNFSDRNFKVRVSPNYDFNAQYSFSVPSGFRRMIQLGEVPNGSFRNCTNRFVHIDLNHKAGQWGCQVFANDKRQVPVYKRAPGYIPCRFVPGRLPSRDIRPQPRRPVPGIRPIR